MSPDPRARRYLVVVTLPSGHQIPDGEDSYDDAQATIRHHKRDTYPQGTTIQFQAQGIVRASWRRDGPRWRRIHHAH